MVQAAAAAQIMQLIGLPEGLYPLSQATIYLAHAPKSNAIKRAYFAAAEDAAATAREPVPLHLRNAVTPLMKATGYGQGYRYVHDDPAARGEMACLPESLRRPGLLRAPARQTGGFIGRPAGASLHKASFMRQLRARPAWQDGVPRGRRTVGWKCGHPTAVRPGSSRMRHRRGMARPPRGRAKVGGYGVAGIVELPRPGFSIGPLPSAAAADRHVVHHHAAGAAGLHHGGHAVAARLDHRAALRVAAGAGDRDAVLGHLALAHAHRQVAAADHHAVHHQQQLHIPPASIVQRFCIMPAASCRRRCR